MIDKQHLRYVAALREREKIYGIPFSTPDIQLTRRTVDGIQSAFSVGGPEMDVEDAPVGDGSNINCRFYHPRRSNGEAPGVLVYLHGGGWMINSVETHDLLCRTYAGLTGLTVVAPRYSKAPENPFPAALNEITEVVSSLFRGRSALKTIPRNILLAGDSAGGNLALATAIQLRDRRRQNATGVIVNYGVLDCDFDTPSYDRFGEGEYLLSRSAMKMFFENYVPAGNFSNPLISPLRADLTGLPPIFVSVGEADVLQSENIELANRAMRANVSCDLDVYSGLMHGFIRIPHYIDRAQLALERQRRWINDLVS
ncbi:MULTISPECIES: alpha/beta hydrolase [unclassified Mesorhizobium]|uniref:alpha/beta hydrolase n=1 Tax=unclassified Mesorhizobium TaxID=325217 RepID=UPI0033351445